MESTAALHESIDGTFDELSGTGYRIACGPWLLVVDSQWTNGILDSYVLHPIPRAPLWLVGYTNVDGILVPVLDLFHLLDPAAAKAGHVDSEVSIRLGSHSPGDNEEAIGLLFTGLPDQLSFTRTPLPPSFVAPPLLCRMALGLAEAPDGRMAIELDTNRLIDHCISQLDVSERLPT
jgi:chemotaxis signal transduction protein